MSSSSPPAHHEEEDGTQTPGAGPSRTTSRQSSRSSRSSRSFTGKGKEPEHVNGVEDEGRIPAKEEVPVESETGSKGEREEDEDSEEDDEDEDEGEEEDEEEEEPTLKYARLKGSLPEILGRDTTSTIEVGARTIGIGTHNGMVHILTYEGAKVTSYRPHRASVTCLKMDEDGDFIATASVEGEVIIHSLTTPESYRFDYKRPMKAVALEPGFGKKTSRSFVCGGMAGKLILQEKGWLGYKETVLHSGEGPIWAVEWRGNLIAWANDLGVKIYDTASGQRIGYVDRGNHAPRAELFKCSLLWKDDSTLVIAWADHIKVIRIRSRSRAQIDTGMPTLTIEMTGIFQVDCMISGIALFNSSYVVLAYISPDSYENEATESREEQRRKAANRPELRLIDKGEETAADALSLTNFHNYGCNDYVLVKSKRNDDELFLVVSPSEVIEVRPRDESDHIKWLVDREKYEEALAAAEALQVQHGSALDVKAIGTKYMQHLIHRGEHARAAALAPKVFGQDAEAWTLSIQTFLDHDQIQAILPEIPTSNPQLARQTYETVLGYLLIHDKQSLLAVIKKWPTDIYDANAVLGNIQGELDASRKDPILVECMGELYLANKQPGRALPYFIRLRQPRVFDLIREYNLFTAVQDQALLLVDFDQETKSGTYGPAIQLLVDHNHSIPIERVVRQLEEKPQYLFLYLRCIFDKDPQLCFPYSDRIIALSATYDPSKMLPFLRASNSYDLEKAYNICQEHDYVPEMVFLLGRMGNNRQALMLIIERLGDVQRAIDFATEQADEDLWEDLLQYSETRPDFIRALLERVGAEINPIRLIRRIKDGMEIPGLKAALIKIVQTSNLQVSLSQDCHRILSGDCSSLASELQVGQTSGVHAKPTSTCAVCGLSAFARDSLSPLVLVYLCRHLVHAQCSLINADTELPTRGENASVSYLLSGDRTSSRKRELGGKLSFAAAVRVRVGRCPVCTHSRGSAVAA